MNNRFSQSRKLHSLLAIGVAGALTSPGAGAQQTPAQPGAPAAPGTAPAQPGAAPLPVPITAGIGEEVERGQNLLAQGNRESVTVLRTAAQRSLEDLMRLAGASALSAPPDKIPTTGPAGDAARMAGEAHLWWGKAAATFGRRDEAITALARAARFSGEFQYGTNTAAREAQLSLRVNLKGGLPLVAPDDTLDTVASVAHFGLWKPQRLPFDFTTAVFEPGQVPTTQHAELLITQGTLFPPEPPDSASSNADKVVVAPLYRNLAEDKLPGVLKLGKMVAGFIKETNGPNKGLWRQIVRVYFPHPVLTRENRNDQPRAEALCIQFLKLHALIRSGAGLDNPYTKDGVTTLWLSEVSALWPIDDDDPSVLQELGVQMPKTNTPQLKKPEAQADIEWTDLTMPWLAAAQIDTGNRLAGDVMFFKMTQPRSESEWLREIAHEYGHLWLPAFGTFRPPHEPFGNGLVGESLGMLWAAALAPQFTITVPNNQSASRAQATRALPGSTPRPGTPSPPATGTNPARTADASASPRLQPLSLRDALLAHVDRNALTSLRFWNSQGPGSTLRTNSVNEGLHYLNGLAVHIERVYGAQALGQASKPLLNRQVGNYSMTERIAPVNAAALLDNLKIALANPFEGDAKTFPIWLPGTVDSTPLNAADLIARGPLKLKANERIACWLYIPPAAKNLRIEWQGAAGVVPRVEGGWKATPAAASAPGAAASVVIATAGRPGWQRLALTAPAEMTINRARFER